MRAAGAVSGVVKEVGMNLSMSGVCFVRSPRIDL
jgi:hypothetical protein